MRAVLFTVALAFSGCASAMITEAPAPIPAIGRVGQVDVEREPVRSYVPEDTNVIGRFDLDRMRRSPNADTYAEVLRRSYTFRTLLHEVGWDPIEDLDRALVASPHLHNPDAVVLLRTRERTAQVRARVAAAWERRGHELICSRTSGFEICAWPQRASGSRVVLFAAEHEIVIASELRIEAVAAVAANQRAHRTRDEIVEPQLLDGDEALGRIRAGNPPWFFHPAPEVADVAIHELSASSPRVLLSLDGKWRSDDEAIDVARQTQELLEQHSRDPMLANFFVSRLIMLIHVDRRADHVVLTADYGPSDLATAITLATMLGGWS